MIAARFSARAVLGFVALKCAVLALNTATFPTLTATRAARPTGRLGTRVSLLVPARDEERNLRRTLPGLLAQPADEILVLDDRSRDATARVVAELAGTDARVRVLSGAPLPPGWVGKTWACHQLAAAATGDVLVFCDADVTLAPGALRSLLAEAEHQQADVFSVFPRQATETLAERLIVPLIDDVLLCFLPHGLLRRPIPAAATANGQLLAFHRAAYDKLDGNRGVRAAIVEDVRLARQARRLGLRLGLALGGDMVCARMYEGYRSTVAGFGKSLLAAHGGSGPVLAGGAGWHLLAYTAPWFRLGRDPVWTAAAVLGVLERILLNAKTGRRAWWEAALVPATPVAALPLYARALLLPPIWKGRTYA